MIQSKLVVIFYHPVVALESLRQPRSFRGIHDNIFFTEIHLMKEVNFQKHLRQSISYTSFIARSNLNVTWSSLLDGDVLQAKRRSFGLQLRVDLKINFISVLDFRCKVDPV